MLRRARVLSYVLAFCAFTFACSNDDPEEGRADGGDRRAERENEDTGSAPRDGGAQRTRVDYHSVIRPAIEASCLDCHVEGGIGPFPLDDWDTVRDMAPLVVAAVSSGVMPPWPASGDCRDLRDAPQISEAMRERFVQWQAAGYPEGDQADYRAPAREEDADRGEPTSLLGPESAYTPPPMTDNYRCFPLVDGVFADDGYLTGMNILPGEPSQVHHVQIHRVSASQVAAIGDIDARNDGPGYPCNAGTGVASQNLFSYRPGSRGVHFDDGDAVYIEAGSALLIQVHYNTQFLSEGTAPAPDETKVALWKLPSGELPDRVIYRTGTIAPLTIPAGEPAYVTQSALSMQAVSAVGGMFGIGGIYVPGEVVGMTPHAHHLASRMSATLRRADGSEECLIEVPEWNFHWQLDYMYRGSMAYGPTDQLIATCEYDNSPENQAVVDGVKLMPRDVTWGEGSLDEMCLHYIWLRFEREAFLQARREAAAAAAPPVPAAP